MVKIKICGLRTLKDAMAAVEAGADALGFVFAKSKRQITPKEARDIIGQLPPLVTTVGVFVNEEAARVREIAQFCRLDRVQLHGEESPDYCRDLNLNVIKAFAVKDAASLKNISLYREVTRGFLLDTYVTGAAGGTGKTFSWPLAQQAAPFGPVILAGGLTPENVAQAIAEAEPYAVDVSSGVETDGVKDAGKMKQFVEAVRRIKK